MKLLFSNPAVLASFPCQCSIIWFAQKGHAELEVDNRLYGIVCGSIRSSLVLKDEEKLDTHTYRIVSDRAENGAGALFYRVILGLTEGEYSDLKKALEEKRAFPNTCAGSITSLLNRTSGVAIPVLQGFSPSALFSHFWETKNAPSSRVREIEYYGPADEAIEEHLRDSQSPETYFAVCQTLRIAFKFWKAAHFLAPLKESISAFSLAILPFINQMRNQHNR